MSWGEKVRQRHWRLVVGLWLVLTGLWWTGLKPPQTVQATAAGFAASAVLPPEQQSRAGYFDLRVKPGTAQRLQLAVENTSQQAKTITITPVDAYTQDNGVIGYAPAGRAPLANAVRLTRLVAGPQRVRLAAGARRVVTFEATIPRSGWRGQVLGSFYLTDGKTHAHQGGGIGLAHRFAIVIGAVLRTNAAPVATQFTLGTVTPQLQANQPAIIAQVNHPVQRLTGQVKLQAAITDHRQRVVLRRRATNYSVAPRSRFNFGVPLGEKLKPGKYHLALTIQADNRTWRFKQGFVVSKQQLATMAAKLNRPQEPAREWWPYVFLTIGAVIVATLAVWVWRRRRRSR